jgi:hypothetical protein
MMYLTQFSANQQPTKVLHLTICSWDASEERDIDIDMLGVWDVDVKQKITRTRLKK